MEKERVAAEETQILRSRTKLEGELAVMGRITHLEVVSKARFEETMPDRIPTADDLNTVDTILSAESEN